MLSQIPPHPTPFNISRLPERNRSNRVGALAKSGMNLSCLWGRGWGFWVPQTHTPPPHPLASDRLETATFSAPTGNGEFVLPPTKIYIFWASLPFIDVNFNLRYDKECASWIESALKVREQFLNSPCLECWRLWLCDRSRSKCWRPTQT